MVPVVVSKNGPQRTILLSILVLVWSPPTLNLDKSVLVLTKRMWQAVPVLALAFKTTDSFHSSFLELSLWEALSC